MFRKVVLPLDGSELAERALPYAVQLCRVGQGHLVLLRVALAPPEMHVDSPDWETDQLEALDEATQYLAAVVRTVGTLVPIETSVVYGRPDVHILHEVKRLGADAIVMATHGRTGLAHLVSGSVAEAVLAHSDVPVFLVHSRPGEAAAPAFDARSARLLVPLDGSVFAEAAVQPALHFLGPAGELLLLRVVEEAEYVENDPDGGGVIELDQIEESRRREARKYLQDIADRLRHDDAHLHVTSEVRMGDAAEGIIVTAVDRVADLVVMATHGRTGLERAVVGSIAGTVLRNGSTPLLLVRPASMTEDHQLALKVSGEPADATDVVRTKQTTPSR